MEDHTHSYNYTADQGPDGQIGLKATRPYASDTLYLDPPDNVLKGHEPLDSLPASWWNFLWQYVCEVQDGFYQDVTGLYNEVCTVITEAIPGAVLDAQRKDQLYQAVKAISEKIATSSSVGGIISSDEGGKVSVDESTGVATANGVGNVADVDPSIRGSTIVDSINNLASSLDDTNGDMIPTNHAYETRKYGGGSPSLYGHVRVSDKLDEVVDGRADESAEGSSTVLSQYAGYQLQNQISSLTKESVIPQFNGDFEYRRGDPRWLIFDFEAHDNGNNQSLYIKAGTYIALVIKSSSSYEKRWLTVPIDTSAGERGGIHIDLSGANLANGTDYFLYLVPLEDAPDDAVYKSEIDNLAIIVSTSDCMAASPSYPSGFSENNCRKIGQFHTLCSSGPTSSFSNPGYSSVSAPVQLIPTYLAHGDPEFANFYSKSNLSSDTSSSEVSFSCTHPLNGFTTNDILPESVWCISWHPHSLGDGMVYNPLAGSCVDIYPVSGTGRNIKSAYGGTIWYTDSPTRTVDIWWAFMYNGKRCIRYQEYLTAAFGTQCLVNVGSKQTTAGGHSASGSRLVSNIGCEDMAGVLNTILDPPVGHGDTSQVSWTAAEYWGRTDKHTIANVAGLNAESFDSHAGILAGEDYAMRRAYAYVSGRGVSDLETNAWPYKWWSD